MQVVGCGIIVWGSCFWIMSYCEVPPYDYGDCGIEGARRLVIYIVIFHILSVGNRLLFVMANTEQKAHGHDK